MAILEIQRDRSYKQGEVGTEGVIWDAGNLRGVSAPDRIAAGESVRISGRLDTDYSPVSGMLFFPVDMRIRVTGGGDSTTVRLDDVQAKDGRTFEATITPNIQPGESAQITVRAEADDYLSGWTNVDTTSVPVRGQTESEQQVDDALDYAPWAIGGAVVGSTYSRYQYGRVNPQYGLIGAGAGVVGREYAMRQGITLPSVPDLPRTELALIGGVLAAGGFALWQAGNVVPDIPGA